MDTVRVLTWNLWWRFGDWSRRLDAITAVVRAAQPDICCFQEVWSSADGDAAAILGERIGLPYVARSYSADPEHWQRRIGAAGIDIGNAIVSRWPITVTESRELPGTPSRTVLAARIAAPDDELPILCTHLSADPAGSAERCDQVRAVVDLAVAFGRGDFPQVVAGDLNAEPDSDEVRLLGGTRTAPHAEGFILLDAWIFAADGDPGWTWRRDNPYIHHSFNARIDYLHIAEPGPDGHGVPLRVGVAGNADIDGVRPSDHLAVVADLKIRRPSPASR